MNILGYGISLPIKAADICLRLLEKLFQPLKTALGRIDFTALDDVFAINSFAFSSILDN